MNLLTASNILFLYNKVNRLLSRWHKNHSHCFLVSSFQAKTLAATSSIYFPLARPVQTVGVSHSCHFYLGGIISAVWAIKQRKCSHFLFIAPDCYRSVWPPVLLPSRAQVDISPLLSTAITMAVFHLFPAGVVCTNLHSDIPVYICTHTTCRGLHTDSHSIRTFINTGRAQCSHAGHSRVSFWHPLTNTGKIQIRISQCFPQPRGEQNEACATSICLFLDSIDLCRSTANVH